MQYVIDDHHPSLPGHFPGQPVVPGVVILNAVFEELARAAQPLRVSGIRRLKFLRRLLPGEPFRVEVGSMQPGRLTFKCWVQEDLLAEGQVTLG